MLSHTIADTFQTGSEMSGDNDVVTKNSCQWEPDPAACHGSSEQSHTCWETGINDSPSLTPHPIIHTLPGSRKLSCSSSQSI